MTDVVAVLVVPVEGDPGGLLAKGRCGSFPPRMMRWETAGFVSDWHEVQHSAREVGGERRGAGSVEALALYSSPIEIRRAYNDGTLVGRVDALPLWWDGAFVPEGWDRARRVVGRHPQTELGVEQFCEDPEPTLAEVICVAMEAVSVGLASRVVRLARVDGRLVEAP